MQNSKIISLLTIFILVSSVTTIALTLEGYHTVFAKKNKSESKTTTDGPTSTPSSGVFIKRMDGTDGWRTIIL
jgi:hypothetical protein